MPVDHELRAREPLLVPDGPRAKDYYATELAVGDFVRLSGDHQANPFPEIRDAVGTVVEIVPAGTLIDVAVPGGLTPFLIPPSAVVRQERPQLGDVRRSPDGKRVAIFEGYRTLYPGRPWTATPAQVLRPQDVVSWTPMKEST